jgi:hypothetical protein
MNLLAVIIPLLVDTKKKGLEFSNAPVLLVRASETDGFELVHLFLEVAQFLVGRLSM